MANTIIGNGDVTAVGVVRGAKVRVPSLADFELGTTLKTGDLAATLAGKAASTHTHAAGDITSGLAAVATSGSYNDLSDKPTIPDVSVKRDKTDLSVYVLSWDFSEFKAIQPTYIYSIKNEEGVGDYVEASGSLGTGPKNVASLMVEQPTAGAWYYHIETITEDGQALNFGPLAGHDIKKTAYEPGTDTLAKVSQIPSVPVSSVNSKTGAVVLTGDDLKFSNEIQSSTVAEAITGLAQEIASSVVTSWQTTPDDTHFPSEKLTKDSLDAKITDPVTGSAGDVLKKTANGTEWGVPTKVYSQSKSTYIDGAGDFYSADTYWTLKIGQNDVANLEHVTQYGNNYWVSAQSVQDLGCRVKLRFSTSDVMWLLENEATSAVLYSEDGSASDEAITFSGAVSATRHASSSAYVKSDSLAKESSLSGKQDSLAYSSTSAYAVGAPCVYQNALYTCKTAISASGEAWTASHWQKVGDLVVSLICGSGSSQQSVTPVSGVADLSSLFTSANTSTDPQPSGALYNAILDKGIVKVVQTICASLDPDNSSIADIIKALKGIN